MTIGDRIKEKREGFGITLRDLSKVVGISSATISRYETGRVKTIPLGKLEKIADALMTNPQYLMGWAVKEQSCYDVRNCDQRFMKKYLQLDEMDQAKVEERINTLLESKKYSIDLIEI